MRASTPLAISAGRRAALPRRANQDIPVVKALRSVGSRRRINVMAIYEVIQDASMSFTARVTRVGGLVETQREFPTEWDALDWVGERLGMDIPARREA